MAIPLKYERYLRWGFASFLVLYFLIGLFEIPTKVFPAFSPLKRNCDIRFTKDVDEQAAIALSPIRPVFTFRGAVREAHQACRRDPSLKMLNVRMNCSRANGTERTSSRVVFCP